MTSFLCPEGKTHPLTDTDVCPYCRIRELEAEVERLRACIVSNLNKYGTEVVRLREQLRNTLDSVAELSNIMVDRDTARRLLRELADRKSGVDAYCRALVAAEKYLEGES